MRTTRLVGTAGVLVALVLLILAWRALALSDVRRIHRRLEALARTASVPAGEAPLARVGRAARVGGFFTEDVVVDLGTPPARVRGRAALIALAARWQPPPAGVQIAFVDITVTVEPDARAATAVLTATGSTVDDVTGERALDAREFELELRKVDDEWYVAVVRGRSAIARP